jgi:pantetheine-phosphate adenylyltransferase
MWYHNPMYNHIVLGGTFDGLHKGHAHILTHAFTVGAHVTIGLTSEAYIKRFKKDSHVAPFSKRYGTLTKWLRKNNFASRATIALLDNHWGPAVLGEYDAIVVTRENREKAEEINAIRKERGIPPLEILEVDLISAQDKHPISSTRIRDGEIDRIGKMTLPDSLRPELQKPLGRLIAEEYISREVMKHKDDIVITVGDITTQTLFSYGVRPSLVIIDLRVERHPYQDLEAYKFPKSYDVVWVVSGPGYISNRAVEEIKKWNRTVRTRKHVVLVVSGEEDLLTLPAIAHAPIGSIVYYGSPMATGVEGLVEVVVTEAKKQEIQGLLVKFT